ncbi:MAG: M20/M25/M40 family metallo-hydrolase [Bacteroidetes bacterium]|nr:M20/M25/M40 family metallo-hydrolase [Bacteroidota bacterium]
MRKYSLHFIVVSIFCSAVVAGCKTTAGTQQSKETDQGISEKEVARIENVLAADDMRGRKVFTPDIDRAADFIAAEFKEAGLQTLNNANSFRQEFSMISTKQLSLTGKFDGNIVDAKNIIVVSGKPQLTVTEKSGYEITSITAGKNIFSEAVNLIQSDKNYLVLVDSSYKDNFPRLVNLKRQMFKQENNTIFVYTSKAPQQYSIDLKQDVTERKMANVVGVLPGKSKKDEYVIFSGHYDHLGVTSKPVNGDSIYNGANDDAAGTTAVIMLAKYFKQLNNNERTIVFAAFTAEEVGGFGSLYFSKQFDPNKVIAMFNIEMIGTESKWGKNSAYITGYEKSNMGEILQSNLKGTGFNFYPDPYPKEQLFYRSDNATLAKLGVPAHTISTSKMDSEPNYHKLSDEVSTLDMSNMASIIKAIALSSKTIIAGTDTPTRVKKEDLR